jgi:hypothetical protein
VRFETLLGGAERAKDGRAFSKRRPRRALCTGA